MKAIWNNKVIAESDDIINIEGNTYFPIEGLNRQYLRKSDTHTLCHWKVKASYYHLEVDKKTNQDSVWHYPEPSELAKSVKDRVAFWRGVRIIND